MRGNQIREAIEYNKARGLDVDEVKMVQGVVGSTPDGVWGPRTVTAIAEWQKEQGLRPDGKVGPTTYAAVINFDACPDYIPPESTVKKAIIGAWGDDAPHVMVKASYADRLVELGISEVALMMNKANISSDADPWDLRWKDRGATGWHDDIIAKIAETYAKRGIRLILTAWPRPDKKQIDEMCDAMAPLLKATNAVAFEVDVEGNWVSKHLRHFKSMKDAGLYLAMSMKDTLRRAGIEDGHTECTTFGHHAELGRNATVTPHVDRACVQAYSTSPRSSGPVAWDSYLGPGRHQAWILKRAKKARAKKVVMGLAAYKQGGFKGHTAMEAMETAYNKTLELGVSHVRYWSTKWILGAQAHNTPYAAKFLETLRER